MPKLSGQLSVVAVGKIKEAHWKQAQQTYVKRLSRYTSFQLIEVKDAVGKGMPDSAAVQKEGERLLQATAVSQRRIALTPQGKQLTSPQLARYLQKRIETYGRLAFLIGGPVGFSNDVLQECNEQISLSAMTFPHELARVILLEQLYRAATIVNGEKYHK